MNVVFAYESPLSRVCSSDEISCLTASSQFFLPGIITRKWVESPSDMEFRMNFQNTPKELVCLFADVLRRGIKIEGVTKTF